MKAPERYHGELPQSVLVWRIRQIEDRLRDMEPELRWKLIRLEIRKRQALAKAGLLKQWREQQRRI